MKNAFEIEEKPKKPKNHEKTDFLKAAERRRRDADAATIQKTSPERTPQIEENRIDTPKTSTKAKKTERDKGFSR